MEAGRLRDMEHFVEGPYGLRDLPPGYETAAPETLDLVLVPAVACDAEGTGSAMGQAIMTATFRRCRRSGGWRCSGISRLCRLCHQTVLTSV